MKSIIGALNNIASSLNAIALAISEKNTLKVPVSSQTTSSGGSGKTTITSTVQYISSEEKVILNEIYSAFTDKGYNPRYHDKQYDILAEQWPVLFKALKKLEDHLNAKRAKIAPFPRKDKGNNYYKPQNPSQFDPNAIWRPKNPK